MIRYVYSIFGRSTLLMVLLWAPKAYADNCLFAPLQGKTCVPDCVRMYCCDDFCPKQVPFTRGIKTTCCDNYCKKPIPCVQRACTVCDDYAPKCLPQVPCPARKLTCIKDFPCRQCKTSTGNQAMFSMDVFRE